MCKGSLGFYLLPLTPNSLEELPIYKFSQPGSLPTALGIGPGTPRPLRGEKHPNLSPDNAFYCSHSLSPHIRVPTASPTLFLTV